MTVMLEVSDIRNFTSCVYGVFMHFPLCLCCVYEYVYTVLGNWVVFVFTVCLLILHCVYAVFMIAGGAALIQYCSVFQRPSLTHNFLNSSLEICR